jgi:N6-adenosine-specific RNA methylase IME4
MTGKYNIIYADPPWTYQDKALAGNRGAGCKYKLMTLDELGAMPIYDLAADNACLFTWVTMPKLDEYFNLMRAWGFKYKTCAFTWIKTNKKSGTLFWGMGRWTRANPEVCLLATKGRPRRISASIHSVIMAPIGKHSEKPDEARQRIVGLCGDLPRVELFARIKPEGWDVFGNEVAGSIIL